MQKRRCGYRFEGCFDSGIQRWSYAYGSSNGEPVGYQSTSERRCNCTLKYGPYTYSNYSNVYNAICTSSLAWTSAYTPWRSWASSRTCPKGWGKGVLFKSSGSNYVQHAQGYLTKSITHTVSTPIYGYVTRYRTAYYNYLSARVAKT